MQKPEQVSAAWAVVIFATDQMAWPLALWIATTVDPGQAVPHHGRFPGGPPLQHPDKTPGHRPTAITHGKTLRPTPREP